MRRLIIILCLLAAGWNCAYAQAVVAGVVVDGSGDPLAGASVCIEGDVSKSVMTDAYGHFSIAGASTGAETTIRVACVGYRPLSVRVDAGCKDYRLVMQPDDSMLDEVVVVGYATQKKVNLTGAVSSVSARALADRPITNATDALAGLAAGLTVVNSGGNTPGYEAQSITVRGLGTLNDAAPLVVVDGMTGIALSDINPRDIESISVLKDAASAAIYGSRAANV